MNKEQYYRWYNKFLNGEITEKEWVEYCHYVLDLLLEENKDVLIRLKEM